MAWPDGGFLDLNDMASEEMVTIKINVSTNSISQCDF